MKKSKRGNTQAGFAVAFIEPYDMCISEKCRDDVEHGLPSRLTLYAARTEPDLKQLMSTYVAVRSNCPQSLVQRATFVVKQGDISSLLIKTTCPSIVRSSPRRSAQKWPETRKDIP
ncbi:MAG TPA: hypothetical protein VFE81_25820 [Paraburkholderia sp.]|nr:hypothetical protein [Paraburkholderia sp.]